MKKILLTCLLAFSSAAFAQVGPPQATSTNSFNGYGFTKSNGAYTALPSTKTIWQSGATLNTNLVSAAINLPSSFKFNGKAYTSIYISNNGFITFSKPGTATNYTPLSTDTSTAANMYDGAVAGFSNNLRNANTATSEISYDTVGSKFIVQFTDLQGSSASTAQLINFQIQLDLSNNSISIVYGNCVSGTSTLTGQVGLKGAENSDVNNRTGADWSSNSIGTINSSTCTIGITNANTVPTSGLTYLYTPGTWLNAPTSFATIPFTENFSTWANGNSTGDLPNVNNWRSWPSRGDNSWRQSDIATTDSGFGSASGWTGVSGASTIASPAVAPAARFHSYNTNSSSTGYMDLYVNLSSGTGNRFLKFDYLNETGSDILTIQISTDGGVTFTNLGSNLGLSSTWSSKNFDLGSSSSTAIVRFLATGDNGDDDIYVDNVDISVYTIPTCTNVTAPANAATAQSLTPIIKWDTAIGATSYLLNLGTTSGGTNVMNGVDVGNVVSYTVPTASPLLYGTTYYTTVTPKSSFGNATGCTEFNFTTKNIGCPTVSAPAANAISQSLTPTITWASVTDATGYRISMGTTSGGTDVMNNVDVGNVLTYTLATPLSNSTKYYYTVNAYTATSNSASCTVRAFSTICSATSAPYSENFDTTSTGGTSNTNAPTCWDYVETASSAAYGYVSSTTPNSAPNSYYLYNAAATTGNSMLVSPETTNLSDGNKRVRFFARSTTAGYNLEVGTITDKSTPASYTITGSAIPLTTTWTQYTVLIPAGTDKFLAFRHGLGGTNRAIYIDDVIVENVPTCGDVTGVTFSNTTANTGQVAWTAPSTAPTSGYDIYYSTTNTTPAVSATPQVISTTNNPHTITGLLPNTTYYTWVRSHCVGSDVGIWSLSSSASTLCQPPVVASTANAAFCPGNTATLTATTSTTGATINWYDVATGGTPIATGNTYTTPVLTNTTNYYASASKATNNNVGLANAISTDGYTLSAGLFFDATSSSILEGVYVYPLGTGAGTITIELQDGNVSPVTMLQTITVNLTGSAAPTKTFVPLNFAITPGTNYKLMMTTKTGGVTGLIRESGASWGAYPINIPGVISITGGNLTANSTSTSYYYFYDWKIVTGCESARQMVTATADASLCLGTSESDLAKNAIKVYPNPFADVLNISDVSNVKSVSVVDIAGRLVKTIDKPNSSLQLGDLKSGMYIVILNMNDGTKQTIKAIKK